MANAAPTLICDPCKESGEEQVPVAFCVECQELYCNFCLNCHKKMKLTKSHVYIFLNGDESGEHCPCDLCNTDNKIVTSLCVECRELYCTACTIRHRKFKVSKDHVVVDIVSRKVDINIKYLGAQVPINENKQQHQQQIIKSVKKEETSSSVSDESKTTHRSEPFQGDNTARRSDKKQKSVSGTFNSTFSVCAPSDKKPGKVHRMISLPDSRICVIDNENYKIKLYTSDYVLCDAVCLPLCRAVTCVDDDTIAVATRSGDITHYSIKGNNITQTGKILHIDGVIYDIAYRRGEFITRYQREKTDCTYCGNKLIVKEKRELTGNDFMQYDSVSDIVVVGKFAECNIICYTVDGDVKWTIKLKDGPTGVAVVQNAVLFADYRNQTIRVITMDGRLVSVPELTKNHGIAFPCAITYQQNQHRLLVTKGYDGNVMVFNLSRTRLQ